MNTTASRPAWSVAAVLIGRLIFTLLFVMAVTFKLVDIDGTAGQIAAAGFPLAGVLVWLAVIFELALIVALATGAYFREAALLAAAYVVFLGFAFHGPSRWAENQNELGFFIDHFTFFAGLLFAAAYGPGKLAIDRSLLRRSA
ncbi:MAG TPA: DoxX family protein [Gammaproteobacteria bacterium]|nr:DoxX family protein [Gammaproteobacteria bacterium]